jgi:hypothetical protein
MSLDSFIINFPPLIELHQSQSFIITMSNFPLEPGYFFIKEALSMRRREGYSRNNERMPGEVALSQSNYACPESLIQNR